MSNIDNKSCETCAYSSRVSGSLVCLGPVAIIFCKRRKHGCKYWEAEKEEKVEEEPET